METSNTYVWAGSSKDYKHSGSLFLLKKGHMFLSHEYQFPTAPEDSQAFALNPGVL